MLAVLTDGPSYARLTELTQEELDAPGFSQNEPSPWVREKVVSHWRKTDRTVPVYEKVRKP